MTRSGIVLWSAVSMLLVGLLAGIALLAAATLIAHLVPGLPPRLIERARGPVIVFCLVVVPIVAGLFGVLEGRAKL